MHAGGVLRSLPLSVPLSLPLSLPLSCPESPLRASLLLGGWLCPCEEEHSGAAAAAAAQGHGNHPGGSEACRSLPAGSNESGPGFDETRLQASHV